MVQCGSRFISSRTQGSRAVMIADRHPSTCRIDGSSDPDSEFELFKEIGRGGMSRVYLARQLQPKREVAIKIVSPGSAPDEAFLSSLKIEGDTIAGLNHDNIVTVFACGVVDKHYYLAMEILPGGDLTERIKKGLRAEDAVEVMIQIGGALGHAHKKQVLHRDIKPENVMFHESGKAVLVDFGIAKEGDTESSFTQVGAVVGTPHYMSPERCMGKSTDARSDLYAMGVMFYKMLTGHKVFEGRDTFAVSYAHVYEPVPPLPPEHARFQGIVNKLLAKDPKDRYQTADEMVAALKKHRAGAPSSAEPATRRVDTTISSPLQEKLKRLAAERHQTRRHDRQPADRAGESARADSGVGAAGGCVRHCVDDSGRGAEGQVGDALWRDPGAGGGDWRWGGVLAEAQERSARGHPQRTATS